MDYYMDVVKKYAVFTGRARRKEFWPFALTNAVIGVVFYILLAATNQNGFIALLSGLYSLAILVPSLAVEVRRLHDTGRSGLLILIGLIPLVGWIILLVFLAQDSQPAANEYGENPKAAA